MSEIVKSQVRVGLLNPFLKFLRKILLHFIYFIVTSDAVSHKNFSIALKGFPTLFEKFFCINYLYFHTMNFTYKHFVAHRVSPYVWWLLQVKAEEVILQLVYNKDYI